MRTKFESESDYCGLCNHLINLLSFYQLKSFSLSTEETFEEGVRVSVNVVLRKYGEASILDNWITNGTDFKVVGAFCEDFVSIDPG